jgi:outer membrane protein OmpA-like peptidoglycan-associated protein
MGRMPQPLPQYTPPGPVEQMPNMGAPQLQCSELAKVHSNAVFPYQANEIATSRTEVGHLAQDVAMVPPGAAICQYLFIVDFGVDWRHLKTTAKLDPLLVLQLHRFETDKSLQFQIVGYSDCVGAERNNLFLRTGRARNVFHLLGPGARSRVFAVKAAPFHDYLYDNATVAGRAGNRAVVIEIIGGATGTI